MKGFEGTPKTPTPTNKESSEAEKVQPENAGRRDFLKMVAGMGVASLGLGITEDAEARSRRVKTEKIGEISVEYHGFEPSAHESKLIEIKLKQLLPTAVSVQFSFDEPMRHINRMRMTQMYMNVLMDDGSVVVCRSDLVDTNTDSGNLAEKITNLFDSLEDGKGIRKFKGKDYTFTIENPK